MCSGFIFEKLWLKSLCYCIGSAGKIYAAELSF